MAYPIADRLEFLTRWLAAPTTAPARAARECRGLVRLQLAVIAYFVLKVSWLADDAYITLRTVDNFLNGYGFRWNVAERVQSFTHPLWMLVLIPFKAILGSSILSLYAPSWLASLAAFALLLGSAATPLASLAGFLALTLSPSIIDFSTSGLESPLTYLLLVGMFRTLPSRAGNPAVFFGLAGLLLLNRLDQVLIVGPLLIAEAFRLGRRLRLIDVVSGTLPLASWLIFSTIYYGSPLPNTYFAKVTAGIATERYLVQAVRYFLDVLLYEPLTMLVVVGGIALGWRNRRSNVPAFALSLGMLLDIVYLVKIGGDFMNARFLTPHVIAAAWILMRWVEAKNEATARFGVPMATGAVLAISAFLLATDLHSFSSRKFGASRPSSISDERLMYFGATGFFPRLWVKLQGKPFDVDHGWADLGRELRTKPPKDVFVHINMGFLGYYAGPAVYIVDGLGLTDAFMARMPVTNFWTAGHGGRVVPDEYVASLNSGHNQFSDKRIRHLFADVLAVTRSNDLFSSQRLSAMWRLNTNAYRDVSAPAPAR